MGMTICPLIPHLGFEAKPGLVTDWGEAAALVEAIAEYRLARRKLIEAIRCRAESMRDPLSEFSEALVAALTGDTPATNPVQKGWDLMFSEGITTQVKYVANPVGKWVNGHDINFRTNDCDRYALVMFEDLVPVTVVIFDRKGLGAVCSRLRKRHPHQDEILQITPANINQLKAEREAFEEEPYLVRIFP